jgi:mono/diheme cytochrome c family protein
MRRLILIAALVVVLGTVLGACGGSSSGASGATSAPTVTTSAASGAAAVWNAQCATCHSPDPAGVGVADAAAVRHVVEKGAEGMPPFAGKLSASEIKAVSEYVAKAGQ